MNETEKEAFKKELKFVGSVVFVLGMLAATPFILLYVYGYFISNIYETVSPANLGSAVFTQERGFLDTTRDLCVRDYAASGSRLIHVHDLDPSYETKIEPVDEIFWSGDGTVIAVKSRQVWFAYYDFRTHQKQKELSSQLSPLPESHQRSRAIAKLLNSRGGPGQEVFKKVFGDGGRRFHEVARHAWWWEQCHRFCCDE